MKKNLIRILGLVSLVVGISLSGCVNNKVPSSSNNNSSTGTSTNPSSENGEPRIVKTYVDWDFNNLNVNDEVPNTASEGAGFSAYRKDENGDVWVRSKNPKDWAAMYFGTPDEYGMEIFLKDFAVETVAYLPEINDGLSNDGGIAILVGPVGRYDAATAFNNEDSSINLWHAGNTSGGPVATTQRNDDWGDRGSKAETLALYPNTEYKITVAGKYQGINQDGDEYFTLFVFIDDRLVIEKKDIAYWTGGFGLRGWQSAVEYKYVKVTDFPIICPDGIDHYTGKNGGTYEPIKVNTPVASLKNNVVTWTSISETQGYQVFVNDKKVLTTKDTAYTVTNKEVGEYKITVLAMGDGRRTIHSDKSNEVIYVVEPSASSTVLDKPIIALNANVVTWNQIDNATSYEVDVNGNKSSTNQNSFFINYGIAGSYIIKVKAIGNGIEYLDSEYSETITYTVSEGTQKTYLQWNFAEVEIGADLPFVAVDGAGFKVVEEDGKKWATSKDVSNWAAVFFGVSDQGVEVFPTDFMMSAKVKTPAGVTAADGGFCFFVGAGGRYDVALYMNGQNSSVNVWKAGDTDNGPKATTQNNPSWGDRGSKVESLDLKTNQEYTFTIMIKSSEDKQTFTMYVFIDNLLVIEHSGIPAMQGGFGLRGWQSATLYRDIYIRDLPAICPDGVNRF